MGQRQAKSERKYERLENQDSTNTEELDCRKVERGHAFQVKKTRFGLDYAHWFLVTDANHETQRIKTIEYTFSDIWFMSRITEKEHEIKSGPVTIEAFQKYFAEEGSLELVEDAAFPTDRAEIDKAIKRAYSRLGEARYHLLYNNCECFVRWALTGLPRSLQTEGAETGKKLSATALNEAVKAGSVRRWLEPFKSSGPLIGVRILANHFSDSFEILLKILSRCSKFLGSTAAAAGIGTAISAVIDIAVAVYNAVNLRKIWKAGYITQQYFSEAWKEEVFGCLGSLSGTALGFGLGLLIAFCSGPFAPIVLPFSTGACMCLGGIAGTFVAKTARAKYAAKKSIKMKQQQNAEEQCQGSALAITAK